jgi:hypothetical protein
LLGLCVLASVRTEYASLRMLALPSIWGLLNGPGNSRALGAVGERGYMRNTK